MNLAEMRAILRRDLRDENTDNYRWSDDELDRHIARAVKEFSDAVPYEVRTPVATTAGSRELDLFGMTPHIMIEAVEYPLGQFPARYQPFSIWGNTLTILGEEVPDGSNARIYYGRLHTLDGSGSTIPAQHEDVVAAGAAGYAAVEWAVYAINRINTGGTVTPGEFLTWGRERLNYFKAELKRLGRRNRVRVRSLYKPYYPVASKRTDSGP